MNNFIKKPSIDIMQGIRITMDTQLEFENENVKQSIRDLVLHTVSVIKGKEYERTCVTKIFLEEGDVLLFEEDGRGYIKPVEDFVAIEEAIEDLVSIKDLG